MVSTTCLTYLRRPNQRLLAGLDQQAYIDLLQTAHNLTRSPAPAASTGG